MLVKSIARKTLGIKNHVIEKVVEEDDSLMIYVNLRKRHKLPCGTCKTPGRVRDRLKQRRWQHVPLWGIPVFLLYAPARVDCRVCGKILVEDIPFSEGKCRTTTAMQSFLVAWCKLLAWDVVARQFGVHWNTVAAAVRQAVAYGLAHRSLEGVTCIGIDELSRKKGHVYVTNVYDLKSKCLLKRPPFR